jgi:tRNA dimethylallyltransferase
MNKYPVICLMGPTASGKTDLALQLVEDFNCDIISVDSAMVYRTMDIGTAKPDPSILETIPHRLINIRDPALPYSAADFCHDAQAAIKESINLKRIPLLVGGTMLYFRALQQGLAELPLADPATREYFNELAKTKGWPALHADLKKIDPIAAGKIHSNDSQRIQRALEVYKLTGKPISELQKSPSITDNHDIDFINIILMPASREWLHQHIALRTDQMLNAGLIDEVRSLYQRKDLSLDTPAVRSVGYQQVWRYLQGEYDESTLREKIIIATRQLAKRQITWLRTWSNPHYFSAPQADLLGQIHLFLIEYANHNKNKEILHVKN